MNILYCNFHLTFASVYIKIYQDIVISISITITISGTRVSSAAFVPFLLDSLREPLYIDILPYYHLQTALCIDIYYYIM